MCCQFLRQQRLVFLFCDRCGIHSTEIIIFSKILGIHSTEIMVFSKILGIHSAEILVFSKILGIHTTEIDLLRKTWIQSIIFTWLLFNDYVLFIEVLVIMLVYSVHSLVFPFCSFAFLFPPKSIQLLFSCFSIISVLIVLILYITYL